MPEGTRGIALPDATRGIAPPEVNRGVPDITTDVARRVAAQQRDLVSAVDPSVDNPIGKSNTSAISTGTATDAYPSGPHEIHLAQEKSLTPAENTPDIAQAPGETVGGDRAEIKAEFPIELDRDAAIELGPDPAIVAGDVAGTGADFPSELGQDAAIVAGEVAGTRADFR
jgi:hypothetical protein